MRIAWVLGWAVPERWFATRMREVIPHAEHRCFAASPNWPDHVRQAGAFDLLGGYSLGAHLLLRDPETANRLASRVGLLAPVRAFAREHGHGGNVSRTQLRYLARWLNADRTAALMDFYARAGLADCDPAEATADRASLQWGLERLLNDEVVNPALPAGWRGYVGERDPLLDARTTAAALTGVTRVPNATHEPAALARAWAEDVFI